MKKTIQATKNKKTSEKQPNSKKVSQEQIRLRAYEIYQTRGLQDGHDMDDWLRAENELRWQ